MELNLAEIADAVSGKILSGEPSTVFTGYHNHSDDAAPGSFYFALKGERVDGHDFLQAVYDAGCMGAMISDEAKFESLRASLDEMCILLVEDAVESLALLGRLVIRRMRPKVIGITGSVGKTGTKEMTAAMLGTMYEVSHSPGNLNTEIGLPIALLNFKGDEEVVVLEMATRGFGQIAHLCGIAPPDVAVITNAGHSHLECFGDVEGVRSAKIEIVENMVQGGIAVIFGDDQALTSMAADLGKRVVTFGQDQDCTYRVGDIKVTADGVSFTIQYDGDEFMTSIESGSRGDAFNCATALAAAHVSGVPIMQALDSVKLLKTSELRLEKRIGPNSSILLMDCYNANPESMRNAVELAVASRRAGGRVIAVLGDMLELGGISGAAHLSLGDELASAGIDLLLTYGEEIRHTAEFFKVEGKHTFHFNNHEDIADWLMNDATEKDVILIKGSRGMALEKVLEFLKDKR